MKSIDVHVHPPTKEYLVESGGGYLKGAFGITKAMKEVDALVDEYRAAGVERAVLLAWDAETNTGRPRTSNDFIAEHVNQFPDFFIGFASVDPWKGELSLAELDRAVKQLGLRGAKFQQPAMAFYPNDPRFDPLWDLCQSLQIPVMFHSGYTGFGAGQPGGAGIHLKYAQPIPYVEDVAVKFPNLTIICAHPGFPWENEQLALVMHKSNVYMDLSGYLPKYIPEIVIRHANSLVQDKVMFGTDYPVLGPQRWIDSFLELGLKDAVVEKILYSNAARLLGVD